MSERKPSGRTDIKDEQKSERQYLTLADKKPSLIRQARNDSASARSISTRELSDNLQRTRDGLLNLMGKKRVDGLGGSDNGNESEDAQKFGKPVRNIESRKGRDAQRLSGANGSFLYKEMNERKKKLGQAGELDSQEFENVDPNRHSDLRADVSNMGIRRSNNGKANKATNQFAPGSNVNCDDDYVKSGNQTDKKNAKLLTSQNPKKDGPLSTRIFIDAFLPSQEGNRIFPLFNFRCAEKIERTSADSYGRNRKRSDKQLSAAGAESGNDKRQIQNDKLRTIVECQDLNLVGEVREIEELENIVDLQPKDELQKVVTLQGGEQIEDLDDVNEMRDVSKLEENQEMERRLENFSQPTETQHSGHTDHTDHADFVGNSADDNQNKSELVDSSKGKATAVHVKGSALEQSIKLSTEEENLLQKLLRTLMENEELIDFFCEKVISKIAARNDFCGPNCKGRCGGLNKPSEANEGLVVKVIADCEYLSKFLF